MDKHCKHIFWKLLKEKKDSIRSFQEWKGRGVAVIVRTKIDSKNMNMKWVLSLEYIWKDIKEF